MRALRRAAVGFLIATGALAQDAPPAPKEIVYQVRDGLVAVEAEHFVEQTATDRRRWQVINMSNDGYRADQVADDVPDLPARTSPDGDSLHARRAGGGSYIEILPDTRRTHDDGLITGVNFTNVAGAIAVISYRVRFPEAGRYYVWVRAHSTGTEDNGVHVGLNGTWPASGQRMQWCDGKRSWYWENAQRTAQNHCGEFREIWLDVEEPGLHTVQFSMREDGFEMDRFLLTTEQFMTRPYSNPGPDPAAYLVSGPDTAVEDGSWGKVKNGP